MLKNPALNGNRMPKEIVEHMDTEKLVLWGWEPGPIGQAASRARTISSASLYCPEIC